MGGWASSPVGHGWGFAGRREGQAEASEQRRGGRTCFPMRPGSLDAMRDQRFGPYCWTSTESCSSSCVLHGPLTGGTCAFRAASISSSSCSARDSFVENVDSGGGGGSIGSGATARGCLGGVGREVSAPLRLRSRGALLPPARFRAWPALSGSDVSCCLGAAGLGAFCRLDSLVLVDSPLRRDRHSTVRATFPGSVSAGAARQSCGGGGFSVAGVPRWRSGSPDTPSRVLNAICVLVNVHRGLPAR